MKQKRLKVLQFVQIQKDIAIKAKAKPVSPCTKPATIAPKAKISQVISRKSHDGKKQTYLDIIIIKG